MERFHYSSPKLRNLFLIWTVLILPYLAGSGCTNAEIPKLGSGNTISLDTPPQQDIPDNPTPTHTPFQPVHPPETPEPTFEQNPANPYSFFVIDFGFPSQTSIEITTPAGNKLDIMPFTPVTQNLSFADLEAYVEKYGNTILMSIEGQDNEFSRTTQILSLIENKGKASWQEAQTRLSQLAGSQVIVFKDGQIFQGIISNTGYLSPEEKDIWGFGTIPEIMQAGGLPPDSGQPRLVIATCSNIISYDAEGNLVWPTYLFEITTGN